MGEDSHGPSGRVESALDEPGMDLPCDFLVLKSRGFDPERVLVPTAGGPDSDLSAEVARLLRAEYGSSITLLCVADSRADGEAFLEEWAADDGLEDAEHRIETGDVAAAIERAAMERTMVILGATERGIFSRLVRGSLVLDVVEDVECSVLLAERAQTRSIISRLFGRSSNVRPSPAPGIDRRGPWRLSESADRLRVRPGRQHGSHVMRTGGML